MASRPAGRPKSAHPRDVKVLVKFTEEEAQWMDQQLGENDSLAGFIRHCVDYYRRQTAIPMIGVREPRRPVSTRAQEAKAKRAERRARTQAAPAVEQVIADTLTAQGDELVGREA
jgi:hypothetical protein